MSSRTPANSLLQHWINIAVFVGHCAEKESQSDNPDYLETNERKMNKQRLPSLVQWNKYSARLIEVVSALQKGSTALRITLSYIFGVSHLPH